LWKEGVSESDFQAALRKYVEEVEAVLRSERGQWGQLISQDRPIEQVSIRIHQQGGEG
jgi:cell division FtsZ-interacting protein ZapD